MGFKVIITGSTGMIGKGVLLECLENEQIEKILLINRNPIDIKHSKIEEVLCPDFLKMESIQEQLKGYDGCFHCMGVSAVGLNEEQYTQLTFQVTKNLSSLLFKHNPQMVFNYVSGVGTDSSEKGSSMWARVKGKTENFILNQGFKDAYAFRPGMIIPEKGVKSRTTWYSVLYVIMRPFFPLFKRSANVVGSTDMGKAMINTLRFPSPIKVLEPKNINGLALAHEQ